MKALWVFLFGMVVDFSTTENPSRLQRKTLTLKTLKTVKSNFDKFNSSIAFALSFKWAWTMWTMWTVSKTENGFWEYDSYLCNRNIAMKQYRHNCEWPTVIIPYAFETYTLLNSVFLHSSSPSSKNESPYTHGFPLNQTSFTAIIKSFLNGPHPLRWLHLWIIFIHKSICFVCSCVCN